MDPVAREVAAAVARQGLKGRNVLVAASAGLDSTALLHALRDLVEKEGLKLSIGHVNHALRGAESEADEAWIRQLGDDLGIPVGVRRADPRGLLEVGPSRSRPTLQEAARRLRYQALEAMAAACGAGHIATAHTADDQAETVLLRLLRGTGPDGLGGIPERSPDGRLLRPLLRVSRAEIETFASERGLSWREDASNAGLDYARNRLRQHWLPGLAREFNPRLLRAITNLAEAQRRDSEWILATVEQEARERFSVATDAEGTWLRLDERQAEEFAQLPGSLSRRLVRWALQRCGGRRDVTRVHLERVLGFLECGRPGSHIELPGGLRLRRDPAGYRLGPIGERPC